jgi:hypothetical protein
MSFKRQTPNSSLASPFSKARTSRSWVPSTSETGEFVIQFKENLRVLSVGGLLLGLSVYSYHVRELLVCWLYFSVLFVCMMLVILIGELGVYAGKCVAVWARSAAEMTPVFEFAAIELPLKNIPEPKKLN